MFDKNLMLLDSVTDVTADVTGAAVDFKGQDLTDVYYGIRVPAVSTGDFDSLVVKIQHSATTTADDFTDLVTSAPITAAGEYVVHARSNKRYRRAVLDTTGGSINLGKVRVGVVAGGTYTNW